MKKLSNLFEKKWFAYGVAACMAVAFYMILSHLAPINNFIGMIWRSISPIFTGFVIAYLLNPIVNFIELYLSKLIKKESLCHIISIVITFILLVLFLAILLALVIPSVISSIMVILDNAPRYQKNLNDILDSLENVINTLDTDQVRSMIEKGAGALFELLPKNLNTIVSTSVDIGKSVVNVLISLILAIYFLAGKNGLKSGINRLRHAILSDANYEKSTTFLTRCHHILIQYIGADLLDALIVAVTNAIIMAILNIPLIPLISVIVGVANLLPTFGPIAGCIIGALILLVINPFSAIAFVIITLVLQTIDGYILKPKLFGQLLGVPPVWILITIILGANLFGVTGIILAIPFAAIISFIYDEAIIPKLLALKGKKPFDPESEDINQP